MQKKLQREIDDAVAAGQLSNPAKYTEITSMKYMYVQPISHPSPPARKADQQHRLAVTNEALRIHPSTGLILERNTPKGGAMLHGKFIPEGTVIGVNCWVVNRDKSIFGADADSFRPERWIDSDPADITKMRTNMFTVSRSEKKTLSMLKLTCAAVWSRREELHREESRHDAADENHRRTLSQLRFDARVPGQGMDGLGGLADATVGYGDGYCEKRCSIGLS
jgi:hypothetical protein